MTHLWHMHTHLGLECIHIHSLCIFRLHTVLASRQNLSLKKICPDEAQCPSYLVCPLNLDVVWCYKNTVGSLQFLNPIFGCILTWWWLPCIFNVLFKCHIPSVLQLFVALWHVMQWGYLSQFLTGLDSISQKPRLWLALFTPWVTILASTEWAWQLHQGWATLAEWYRETHVAFVHAAPFSK